MTVSFRRFRTGSDVQRRIRTGKPSSGGGVQIVAERRMRYIPERQQETEADAAQNGHRHGTIIIIMAHRVQYACNTAHPGPYLEIRVNFFTLEELKSQII